MIQSRNLATQGDTLPPKFLSGELRFQEVKQLIEVNL